MDIPQDGWQLRHYRFGLAGEGQADVIERFLRSEPGTVLDIGCGPQGRHAANLAALSALLVAADRSYEMVMSASLDRPMPPNASFLVADAYSLPLRDNSVDHIVALGLFAYVEKPEQLFAEFRRVAQRCAKVFVSNSVAHPRGVLVQSAAAAGLRLVREDEGYCPAASGPVKRRYLCVFEPRR